MASLAQSVLLGLLTQREMALARLAQLDADIAKLREQIAEADKNGHRVIVK